MLSGAVSGFLALTVLFAQLPSSSNYKLNSYGIGSGGTAGSSGSTYQLEGTVGETGGAEQAGATYNMTLGATATMQAYVPVAPTFTNVGNTYNKLHFVVNVSDNPSDTTFAIAISTDDFATTQYIQNDNTVGATLGSEDYQTYAQWGSATGEDVIGLTPDTTYKIKVKAMQGAFTETGFGPTATAATVDPSLTFDIDVSAVDTETNPPFSISFGDLLVGSVNDSPSKIWLDFDTNGSSGGNLYIYSANGGLKSVAMAHTITSSSADLSVATEGFGAQSASATQSAGGPLASLSPYNGNSQSVGVTDLNIRPVYSSTTAVSAGRASLLLKAKTHSLTPAAEDYSDGLTIIGAASF